ncbi:MAG: hypothetical protein COU27_00390 [Candidatus Levybacteria bacterium CG10_big_fil_rev_8_21_14_0_10_36_7]|nr:MAG: hypothetical protein COU27_00390 [Candidatus Levybacteria bacterium CG10_big_fil_rev_8_21_14_0_10_36_7]
MNQLYKLQRQIKSNSWILPILLIFILAAFYKLSSLMVFIGDQGWFYISAKSMLYGQIPLVGITSSNVWIHQGALWTYMLFPVLFLFNFDPLGGAYLSILLTVISIVFLYILLKEMYSVRVALTASLFYATSPLVIIHSRLPYHTSPIPLFVILYLLFLYRWASGEKKYFPFIFLTLSILYNFELATIILWPILLVIVLYLYKTNLKLVKSSLSSKNILLAVALFIIPMVPFLIYDINHGYLQTFGFAKWVILRPFYIFSEGLGEKEFYQTVLFFLNKYSQTVFISNVFLAFTFFVASIYVLFLNLHQEILKRKKKIIESLILASSFIIPLLAFFINKTPSEAYLVIFFPIWFSSLALVLESLYKEKLLFFAFFIIFTLPFLNLSYLISTNYLMNIKNGYGIGLGEKVKIAKQIILKADGSKYSLVMGGVGSKYESGVMPYEYLLWELGNKPSKKIENKAFLIIESYNKVIVIDRDVVKYK